jgi:exopolyphosphatase/guanosine-5'-triphosphate,3'-diphosphate pyrophosphatase
MRAAVFDIGTNTVRVLEGSSAPTDVVEHFRDQRVVRLGEGVSGTGRFRPDAVERTLQGLWELRSQCGTLDVVDAVATSATRDAANREDFLGRAESILGVRPRVIEGVEEARLSFAGALSGADYDGPVTVIDVGGGSTEFVFGRDEVEYAVSIDIGSVRITEAAVPSRPAAPQELEHAGAWLAHRLEALEIPEGEATVVGVAGTFTALGAIDLGLERYDREIVHQHRMSLGGLRSVTQQLSRMTVGETAAIPSLPASRAEVLFGGALVATAALEAVGGDAVIISETDLLDGLLEAVLNGRN